MSIENIKSRLKTLEKEANDNEQLRANSHESSLFYAKDVESNKGLAQSIDGMLNDIGTGVNSIMNLAREYSYSSTLHELVHAKQQASKTFYSKIMDVLIKGSHESFEIYNTKYTSNFERINTTINHVKNYIKEYNKLTSEIESIRQDIYHRESMATPTAPAHTSSLEIRKQRCKNRQKTIISMCDNFLSQIASLNNQNIKLLNDGLKQGK